MNEFDAFFEALDEAINRAGNANRLARLTGIQAQSILRWQKRERTPTLEGIVQLLPFIDWPKRGKQRSEEAAPTMHKMGTYAPVEKVEGDDLKSIPVIFTAGCGNPQDEEVNFIKMEPDKFIKVLPRYYTEDTRAIEIIGDSMYPTIHNGAIVGIRPHVGPIKEGAIYLVRLPSFGFVVKRVKPNGLNGIMLVSDNPNYDPIPVPFEEGYADIIVGRVDWIWQNT